MSSRLGVRSCADTLTRWARVHFCRYRLLNTYEVSVSKEESDQVADLRYSWRKLLNLSNEVNNNLADLQVGFKRDLVRNVKVFLQDVEKFRLDFQTNGPMVKGITANEATARLKRFQMLYEQRERKFKNYRSGGCLPPRLPLVSRRARRRAHTRCGGALPGEELFGLTPTQYPELERTKKELDLLERLYGGPAWRLRGGSARERRALSSARFHLPCSPVHGGE